MARSSGWIRSNTSAPMRGSISSPRIRSVTGLAYTSRPWGSTIAMMSLESRTIARKRASFRSSSAVTWSTVRAARRPTTRVEMIARTTIATSTTPARIPCALTSCLRYFGCSTLSGELPGRSGRAVAEERLDDGARGRGGRDRAPGHLELELPGQRTGGLVGGERLEERGGDLPPHPLTALVGAQRGQRVGDPGTELLDCVPDLADALAQQRRARQHARIPSGEARAYEVERGGVVSRGVGGGGGEVAVGLVHDDQVGELHDPALEPLELVA